MLVILEPPGVIVNDIFKPGDLIFKVHELICLFLIFCQGESAFGVINNIVKLLVYCILV